MAVERLRNALRESKFLGEHAPDPPRWVVGLASYIHSITVVEVHNQRCNLPPPPQQLCNSPLREAVYGPDVCMQVVLYTVSIPKVLIVNNIWLFFLFSLHFKDNTVCIIEHTHFF